MSSTFKINNSGGIQATLVANAFIDHYMLQANGEFVKIYLYLLRMLHNPSAEISLSAIADDFSCTEKDVMRALNYWKKVHILDLEFDRTLPDFSCCRFLKQKILLQKQPHRPL